MSQTLQIANDSLSAASIRGVEHFATGNWETSTAEGDFLATLALRIVLAGYLVGSVERVIANDVTHVLVRLDPNNTDPDRRRAAKLLFDPLDVYAELSGIIVKRTSPSDVGALQGGLFAGVVIVTVIAGATAVMLYVAEKSATIVDNVLKRNAASKAIQEADAKHLEAMNLHVQREQAAQRALPFDDVEKSFMSALEARKNQLIKSAFEEAQKSFPTWILPVGLGAAAILTAFVLIKKRKQK